MPVGGSILLPLQIFTPDPLEDLGPISVDERFSTLLSTLAPEFVQSDHQKFIAFLNAFFEYLEIHGNPRAEAVRMGSYTDVDRTLDDFIKFFRSAYLNEFPEQFDSGAIEELIVRNSSDYYGEKGNSRSIDYLFRILFGISAEIDTPKDKLFKISDSDYSPSVILYASHYNGQEDISLYKGSQIQQRSLDDFTSEVVATALIDDITFHLDEGVEYAKLFLKDVRGTFKPNNYVELYRANRTRLSIERTFPIVSNLNVTTAGTNYAVGDDILVYDSKNKLVLSAEVQVINSLGAIESITSFGVQNKIFFPGESYRIEVSTASGSGAVFTIDGNIAAVTNKNFFSSQRSLLSSDSFVQDNFKFQNFSYIIRAEKQIKDYAAIVRKIFHPAGSVMLADFLNKNDFRGVKFTHKNYQDSSFVDPVIGNFLPYTFAATADFRGQTFGSPINDFFDYYPEGFNGITAATISQIDGLGNPVVHDPFNNNTFVLGPIGGITMNGFNPDYPIDGSVKQGYQQAENPQVTYASTDNSNSPFYIIASHPKTLLTNSLPAASSTAVQEQNTTSFNKNLIKRSEGSPEIIRRTITLALDANAGITPGFAVDDIVRQKVPNSPEAIGRITSVESVDGEVSSFYRQKTVAQVIKEYNDKRPQLDVGADAEPVDEIVSETTVSKSGSSGVSESAALTRYSFASVASYAAESTTVDVKEVTLRSGKKELVTVTTDETPEDIIKDDPRGSYQTSISTSEVLDAKTLKPQTITIQMISGSFSNESDRFGNRFLIKSDAGGQALLATALNTDKSTRGTVNQESRTVERGTGVPFEEIVIGDFLNFLESPD